MIETSVALLLIITVALIAGLFRRNLTVNARLYVSLAGWLGAIALWGFEGGSYSMLGVVVILTISLLIFVLQSANVLRSRFWSLFHL